MMPLITLSLQVFFSRWEISLHLFLYNDTRYSILFAYEFDSHRLVVNYQSEWLLLVFTHWER